MVGIGETPPPHPTPPSEAAASLMAVEVKRLLPQHPRGHIIAPVSSHYPPEAVSPRFRTSWSTSIFPPTAARRWTSAAAAPNESEALHLCNHRQLVPSDYVALNAVLSAVAHSNTERD